MQRSPPQPFRFNPPPNQYQPPARQLGGPSRTQQMFRAQPPNYNPQSNVFRLNKNQPSPPAPKPMSGVQHFVPKTLPPNLSGHDWRRQGNPPPSNYFKSKEMNINECFDENPYNIYYDEVNYGNYYYSEYDYDNAPTYNDSYFCDDNTMQPETLANEPPTCDEPQASSSQSPQDFQTTTAYKKSR